MDAHATHQLARRAHSAQHACQQRTSAVQRLPLRAKQATLADGTWRGSGDAELETEARLGAVLRASSSVQSEIEAALDDMRSELGGLLEAARALRGPVGAHARKRAGL